jgi:predicted glycogen debranching enzyme
MRIALSRSQFARPAGALDAEWLVTNGLGGFAAGTISLANTRRYHALLIAALRPPVDRIVMVSKADVSIEYLGRHYELGCNEFADGTLAPRGFEYLCDFQLVQGLPVWTYALADAVLEQRICMEYGQNSSYLRLTLRSASQPLNVQIVPLCTYRDYHAHSHGGWQLHVTAQQHACTITAFAGARPYRLEIDHGAFTARTDWYWNFLHRAERDRGLDATEDLLRPGVFDGTLISGGSLTLRVSAESTMRPLRGDPFQRELSRRGAQQGRLPKETPEWIHTLALSADQFIVRRSVPEGAPMQGASPGTTIIAGYPWFSDWGRDTMIALPGLTLATGRVQDAASILRTFAQNTSRGMLPNRFPDGGEAPEYNTVDAALWLFHALDVYLGATDDQALLADIFPTLKEIIRCHDAGTRYGIHVDAADGLLRAGEPGVQLTWMDARVADWVVTPRIGKPVEINALWHFALDRLARWARMLGEVSLAAEYDGRAQRVQDSFNRAYWYEQGGYLYDVVDGPDGEVDVNGRRVDRSLRPNQIFAVSLGTDLLDARRARSVLEVCARELLTAVGLRSLSPQDPRYVGRYEGGVRQRDGAYHQGTVWSWLLGPYALAHYRVYGDAERARGLLSGLEAHLQEACLGTISEIFDGDAPHLPRGCVAQAWSVAETLRAWSALGRLNAVQRAPFEQASGA